MTLTVLSTDITSVGTAYSIGLSGTLVVEPDVTLLSTVGDGIFSDGTNNNVSVVLAGSIYVNGNGIRLTTDGTTFGNAVTILSTGRIVADTFTGVAVEGDNATIINHGEVVSSGSTGLFAEDATNVSIYNYGTVTASGTGAFSRGISIDSSVDEARIVNHGTVTANSAAFGAVRTGATTTTHFVNTGIASGAASAYSSDGAGQDFVTNFGVLNGNVNLGSNADSYRAVGNGAVVGEVNGSSGNDTLIGANANDTLNGDPGNDYLRGGAGSDLIDGGGNNDSILGDAGNDVITGGFSGADTIRGGSGDDHITGGPDAGLMFGDAGQDTIIGGDSGDVIWGGTGEDSLEGGLGNDTINGGSGRDEILGGDDNDMLRGGGEADLINGEDGDDTIQGGAGDDTIAGGLGRDIMNGGSGADQFRFTATNQSAVGALRDTIQDFEVGVDTLDLGAIPGTLNFVGTGPLTGTAPEVRAAVIGGGAHTLIQIDADGNGTVDSEILLTFSTGLTVDDFIL